jgi:CRISPR-associated protein (TIGR03986 family)
MEVKSPYNFVPAPTEDQVFKPDWASQVSHDIPFEEGQSGELDITITAETPIFIRNGHSKPADGENPTSEFSHFIDAQGSKKYFIPATSIKGMLRNVLEIMSFSRMRQVEDDTHSVRQIMKTISTVVDEGYTLNGEEKKNINCGYLIEKNGEYFIYDCGRPLKIRYTELDEILNTNFGDIFGNKVDADFSKRTGAYKYENLMLGKSLEHKFEIHPLDENKQSSWVSKFQSLNYVKFSKDKFSKDFFYGRIVCVGQASPYSVTTARRGEYVFHGKKEDVVNNEKQKIVLEKKVLESFLFVNKHNKGKNEELKDWTFWKQKTKEGIPVFFRTEEKTINGSKIKHIKDFGLTFMYKEPVQNSVIESGLNYKKNSDSSYKSDLAELIFGKSYKDDMLKGRVFISNFMCTSLSKELPERQLLLASPKSSYFPFYLKQENNGGITKIYNTYNLNPKIRGFKKYPVRNTIFNQDIKGLSPEMLSKFKPLDKGVIFKGKIRFHNLRKAELGALVSAITFHNAQDKFHAIGSGKAFGYGRVNLNLDLANNKVNDYLKSFEIEMKSHNITWENQMKELLAVSSLANKDSYLEFMPLADFQTAKNEGRVLQDYSKITNFTGEIMSKASIEDVGLSVVEKNKIKAKKIQIIKELESRADEYENLEDLENAIKTLKHISELDGNYDFKEKVELYFKKQAEKEVEKEIDLVLNSNNLELIRSTISIYPSHPQIQNLRNKEVELRIANKIQLAQNQANETLVFKDSNFESIKNTCNPFLKNKQFVFSETQKKQIVEILKESYVFDSKKNMVEWNKNKGDFKKYPWTEVTKWIGETQAIELHKELTSK